MGNVNARSLPSDSSRMSYDAIFTMSVAGEDFSILRASDPTPEQVAALDADGYKQLLAETGARKLDKLAIVIKANYGQVAANQRAERNAPEELIKREKKREELDALREERVQVTLQNGATDPDDVDWSDEAYEAAPVGWGRYDETCEEMQEVADRRSRYRAARDGLAKSKAQATADIEAMHRV